MAERALPARFPPYGAWPGVMRADLVAAFFDCRDTGELARRVRDGDIPRPTALRGIGRKREPVWALESCQRFIARRHQISEHEAVAESVANLI